MSSKRLQRELKKRRPFATPEQEAVLNLLRTSDQIENRLGRLFREHGLTNAQYNVLRILRGEGAPLPSLEIADRMIQVAPAITRLVNQLEKDQLVVRNRCPEDRRVVRVELTDNAAKRLAKIDQPLAELEAALMSGLSKSELAELSRLLEKARGGGADA